MPRERLERRNNYMDFSFTEEQELLAENLVEFMDREYPESLIKECDEQKIFPVEANKKFYEAGFGAIGVPEELGGVPADMVSGHFHCVSLLLGRMHL